MTFRYQISRSLNFFTAAPLVDVSSTFYVNNKRTFKFFVDSILFPVNNKKIYIFFLLKSKLITIKIQSSNKMSTFFEALMASH